MCGINAVFVYRGRPSDTLGQELVAVRDAMSCRGPDGAGAWTSPGGNVALGHRRLAIIDLSPSGAQPMTSGDEALHISFNGEIYNYRELRSELEAAGCRFRSTSDTEVILELYARHGERMLPKLRGMFALALWDSRRNGMLVARDPFGIKPLYYADDGATFRVASEVKALLSTRAVDDSPSAAGHVGFFLWGHVPEPHTLYAGIRALPAGSSVWIDANGRQPVQEYFNVSSLIREAEALGLRSAASDATAFVTAALRDSVAHHLVADVDVGVFLSAGLDSTTVASLASEITGRLKTVTLGFTEFRGTPLDETPLAEEVARQLGSDHHTIWVREEDFRLERERFLDRMDQPSIDGLNSFFVARAAAEAGLKVVLSGLGGDELFGGYPSFSEIPRLVSVGGLVPGSQALGSVLRRISAPVLDRFTSAKYAGLLEYGTTVTDAYFLRRGLFMPWEIPHLMDPDFAAAGLEALRLRESLRESVRGIHSTRLQITALEAQWYMRNQLLRDTDWASMSHSVEVRVPLVDPLLWQTVLPFAASPRLSVNKQMMARSPVRPLPASVMQRPKTGFGIPVRDWLTGTHGDQYSGRRLRGWARLVYEHQHPTAPNRIRVRPERVLQNTASRG